MKFLFTCLILCFAIFSVQAEDLSEVYKKDYRKFWDIWSKHRDNFKACESVESSKKFLEIALSTLGNAEVSEANSEVIEEVSLNKPKCLLEAIVSLAESGQERILNSYIVRPTFHEIDQIQESLQNAWEEEKYKNIKLGFFRLKEETYGQ